MMATLNEVYFDSAVSHQIDVRRYLVGFSKQALNLQGQYDQELIDFLTIWWPRVSKSNRIDTKKWAEFLSRVNTLRQAGDKAVNELLRKELRQFIRIEAEYEQDNLNEIYGAAFGLLFAGASASTLYTALFKQPYQGLIYNDWIKTVHSRDRAQLKQVLQLSRLQALNTGRMLDQVAGTAGANFANGALASTRRGLHAIIDTTITHASTAAKMKVWEANNDVIRAVIWKAVLDNRTTLLCISRHGKGRPLGNYPLPANIEPLKPLHVRPPAHIRCRSMLMPWLSPTGISQRSQFVNAIQVKKKLGLFHNRSFSSFLQRQGAKFQDEVLGPTRGRLFRKGGLKLENYVDRQGNELTLDQLANRHPKAFIKVGLDPKAF